jgi:hypothetical protein
MRLPSPLTSPSTTGISMRLGITGSTTMVSCG